MRQEHERAIAKYPIEGSLCGRYERLTEWKLDQRLWTDRYGDYKGCAYARMVLTLDHLMLSFRVEEDPRTFPPRAEGDTPGDPVCQDSAVEFFLRPAGAEDYINLEFNSRGCWLAEIGPAREDRRPISDEIAEDLMIIPWREDHERPGREGAHDTTWGLKVEIPTRLLTRYFGDLASFEDGATWEGNLYKCGDLTPYPHFHALFPVHAADPDFHRPQDFGTFTIQTEDVTV